MNGPGDIPTTNSTSTERPCGLTSLLPSFGMSCRGRAEAFARRLQSRLRTLGSQTIDTTHSEEDAIINPSENTWISSDDHQQVTSLQPLRHLSHEADSFFDFDCEPESPGSPADECEYSRLIETTSTTPQNDYAPESGYICASPITPENVSQGSQSSSDGPYFDPESSEAEPRTIASDYYDCVEAKQEVINENAVNGSLNETETNVINDSSDSLSESLPISQESTPTNNTTGTQSSLTFTGATSASNSTLQDIVLTELQQQTADMKLYNGHVGEDELDSAEENLLRKISKLEEDKLTPKLEQQLKELERNESKQLREIEIEVTETKEVEKTEAVVTEKTEVVAEKTEVVAAEKTEAVAAEKTEVVAEKTEKVERKHLSSGGDTDDDDDCRPQRVRRCSSLKTGKTPPGTPGRKKIVRFADVLGLDLADVKTFLDEIPTIPKSAYEDLEVADVVEAPISLGPRADKMLMPLFQQPGGLPNFLDIVREKQVSLENAAVTDVINLTINGSVRVRNLDFHKSVHIRYSLDSWRSFADLQARYVENSCDGFSDKFTFTLFGNSLTIGQRLEFAVRFQCRGQQFWDNNYGANYCFQCLPAASAMPARPIHTHQHTEHVPLTDTWCSSFY